MRPIERHPTYLKRVDEIKAILNEDISLRKKEFKLLRLSRWFLAEKRDFQGRLDQGAIIEQSQGHHWSEMIDIYAKLAEDALDMADSVYAEIHSG